jgi:hypothetical protein
MRREHEKIGGVGRGNGYGTGVGRNPSLGAGRTSEWPYWQPEGSAGHEIEQISSPTPILTGANNARISVYCQGQSHEPSWVGDRWMEFTTRGQATFATNTSTGKSVPIIVHSTSQYISVPNWTDTGVSGSWLQEYHYTGPNVPKTTLCTASSFSSGGLAGFWYVRAFFPRGLPE